MIYVGFQISEFVTVVFASVVVAISYDVVPVSNDVWYEVPAVGPNVDDIVGVVDVGISISDGSQLISIDIVKKFPGEKMYILLLDFERLLSFEKSSFSQCLLFSLEQKNVLQT